MVYKSKGIKCLTPTYSHIHWSTLIDSSLASVHLEIKQTGENADTSKEPNPEVEVEVNGLTP